MSVKIQGTLFTERPETLNEIKRNPIKCPHCGQRIAAHCKTMDKRLVQLMTMALSWLKEAGKNLDSTFDKADIYGDSGRMNSDFNKLHCWGLVERVRSRVYRFTPRGLAFLLGERKIPKRVWVYNDTTYDQDDEYVSANEVDDRWQFLRIHYSLDYVTVDDNRLPI